MDSARQIRMIRKRLTAWYRRAARDLPWRRTGDPYLVWVSEIMTQQTRVDQAAPYFQRFADRYPTVDVLADADLDTVLRDWEGLGYYARARNLHRAARLIVRERQGRFPSRYDEMLDLPGVGAYTAAAVMSIAYSEPYAAVDGNVIRVLSRVFEVDDDPMSAAGKGRLQTLANQLLDVDDPGTFNQAVMELGAIMCLPRRPLCDECPLKETCGAHAAGHVSRYPARRPRGPVPHHDVAVAVVCEDQASVFIQKRSEDGMLGGLWEFPGGKIRPGETAEQACRREALEELGATVETIRALDPISHAYSHFTVTLHPFICRLTDGRPQTALESRWVTIERLTELAFPRANRRLTEQLADWAADPPGREAPREVDS